MKTITLALLVSITALAWILAASGQSTNKIAPTANGGAGMAFPEAMPAMVNTNFVGDNMPMMVSTNQALDNMPTVYVKDGQLWNLPDMPNPVGIYTNLPVRTNFGSWGKVVSSAHTNRAVSGWRDDHLRERFNNFHTNMWMDTNNIIHHK